LKAFRTRILLPVGLLFLAATFSQSWAHALLVKSNPANGSTIQAPKSIELWFNELLDDNFNKVEIFGAGDAKGKERKNLAKGKPQLSGKDRTHLTVEVGTLSPGDYVIEYRVLSRDGHSAPGRITFTVSESKK